MPKWILISSVAIVIAVGSVVYYLFPKQSQDSGPVVLKQPTISQTGNPLLTADKSQFNRWFPSYCGADMFVASPPKQQDVDVCVNGIVQRVEAATGAKLTRDDVLDPAVKAHWLEVVKGQ